MKFVVKAWYHKSRLWKKIEKISQKLSHTLVTGWGIAKKFRDMWMSPLSFWVQWTIKLRYDFKTFCVGNGHDWLVYAKYSLFFSPFDNIKFFYYYVNWIWTYTAWNNGIFWLKYVKFFIYAIDLINLFMLNFGYFSKKIHIFLSNVEN